MTAELTQPESIDDYTHPYWCDLSTCEPQRDKGGMHHHPGTMLPIGAWHAMTRLVRADDFRPGTRIQVARAHVQLVIRDVECGGDATTFLEPHEARLLAQVLTMYADKCEQERRLPIEQTAQEIREDNAR